MSALDYSKFDELDFSSDEDDCHPNIEINTWRRLKERMRAEKGLVKKEPILIDKWNTTEVNAKKTKYDITGQGNDDTHEKANANDSSDTSNNSTSDTSNNASNANESKEDTSDAAPVSASKANEADSNDNESKRKDDTQTSSNSSNASSAPVAAKPATSASAASSASSAAKSVVVAANDANDANGKKAEPEEESGSGHLFEARSDPKTFLDEYLPKIKKFAKMKSDDAADEFIQKYYELVHEATEGYIITFAVDRAVEGATAKQLAKYSRRCLTIHNLIQSCQSANVAPQVGVSLFFKKMSNPQLKGMYRVELEKQVGELLGRIEVRRKERLAEAEAAYARGELDDTRYVEEKAPVGPGGLDPTEVLNSLPEEMQKAFISRDVDELRRVLSEMPVEDASRYMQQCIDSGLWVDNSDETDEPQAEPQAEPQNENGASDENDVTPHQVI